MKRKLTLVIFTLTFLVICILSHDAAAAVIITTPSGLNPGDHFYMVFVTDSTRDASSSNIADYDAFVTADANAVGGFTYNGNPLTWQALASTDTVSAVSRFNPGIGIGVFQLNGYESADHTIAGFWSYAYPDIAAAPSGANENGESVWSGSYEDGTPRAGAALGNGNVAFGVPGSFTSDWINFSTDPNHYENHLYAFSNELTVVPEPTTTTLLLTGLAVTYAMRRKSRLSASRLL